MGKVEIYTDGACSGNPGVGGWGAVLIRSDGTQEISGGDIETTNNRMEMKAVIEALSSLKERSTVNLHTDSMYVKNGITVWIKKWRVNGWQTANKSPVKNSELWVKLSDLVDSHEVSWHWVKGHSGNRYNDRADLLARKQIEELSSV